MSWQVRLFKEILMLSYVFQTDWCTERTKYERKVFSKITLILKQAQPPGEKVQKKYCITILQMLWEAMYPKYLFIMPYNCRVPMMNTHTYELSKKGGARYSRFMYF